MSYKNFKKNLLQAGLKGIYAGLFLLLLYLLLLYKVYYFFNVSESIWFAVYGILVSFFLLSRFFILIFYVDKHDEILKQKYPSITFVIACKNEEDSIGKTIDVCFQSEYLGIIDLVAIDDGSTDGTWKEMLRRKKRYGDRIQLTKFEKNRGKREGMGEGISKSRGEIIIFVDSDSFIKPDGARLLVEHFMVDEHVGAVSGNTLVENVNVNLLTKMQSARYGVAFDIFKACESVFGAVTCCPGCFSAYRKTAILEVVERWLNQSFLGSRSTFGDDRSLTNFVMRKWKIVYCREAKATTIVPEKYKKFFNQQLRWKKSWIREGIFNAGKIMWRKNIIAAVSFYINVLLPLFGPIILFKVIVIDTIMRGQLPVIFVGGVVAMSLLFGLCYAFISMNKYWFYVAAFAFLYTFFLVWQMPYAMMTLKNTKWGTR